MFARVRNGFNPWTDVKGFYVAAMFDVKINRLLYLPEMIAVLNRKDNR